MFMTSSQWAITGGVGLFISGRAVKRPDPLVGSIVKLERSLVASISIVGNHAQAKKRSQKQSVKQKDLGRARAQTTLLVFLLVPLRRWKTAPASFLSRQGLLRFDERCLHWLQSSQSPDSLRRREERGRKKKRDGLADLVMWRGVKMENSQLIRSQRLACVIERDTPGGEESFRRGVFEEHLWLYQTVLPSYFWIWISTLQDHNFNRRGWKKKTRRVRTKASVSPQWPDVGWIFADCSTSLPLSLSARLHPLPPESTVFFPEQIQSVEEDVGELFIPVHRSGDISQELMVVCHTQQGRDDLISHI